MYITTTNDLGNVMTTTGVIADIAGAVAAKCYGVVGMASRSKKDGFVSLLRAENMSKGIAVEETEDGIAVDLHIIVEYGVNIATICKSIVNRVRYNLEQMTGLSIKQINVRVEGVRVDE